MSIIKSRTKNRIEILLVAILYIALTLFFFREIIFSPGAILSGDWALPHTLTQMLKFASDGFYRWTDRSLLGIEQLFVSPAPIFIIIGALAKIGITGDSYSRLLLVFSFAFPAFTMYLFCKFLGCSSKISILGGFLYFTLPFFFNYAVMGWLFILVSMGILPLALICFIKSVRENNPIYSILTGLLYFLAIIQIQSLFWYPLLFIAISLFVIKDKKSLWIYLKSLLIVFLVFGGMAASLYVPILFSGGSGILSTKLGLSSPSLGTWARLSNIYIIRGWGSLFNSSYEASIYGLLGALSFLLPLLAYSSLIFLKGKKVIYPFIIVSFITILLFKLGPSVIIRIPFSDIIRDIARFLAVTSFCYVVLAVLALDHMFKQKKLWIKIFATVSCILLLVNSYPFFIGELYSNVRYNYDIKLRTFEFPKGYTMAEDFFTRGKDDFKVLYLPIGGAIRIMNDSRFDGTYEGMRDVFSSISTKPADTGISDKGMGTGRGLIFRLKEIEENQEFDYLPKLLSIVNVKYVAVRKDAIFINSSGNVSGKTIIPLLNKIEGLVQIEDWEGITIFENKYFLPHFYIPKEIVALPDGEVNTFYQLLSNPDYDLLTALYIDGQNEKWVLNSILAKINQESVANEAKQPPKLEIKKINSTKYKIVVYGAKDNFPLVFSESFHKNWNVYLSDKIEGNKENINSSDVLYNTIYNNNIPSGGIFDGLFKKPVIDQNEHFIVNDYANAWIIQPEKLCSENPGKCVKDHDGNYDFEIVIEFWSQQLFYIGSLISCFTLLISLIFMSGCWVVRRRRKIHKRS